MVVSSLPVPTGSEGGEQLPEELLPGVPKLQPGPRLDGDGLQRVHQRILRQDRCGLSFPRSLLQGVWGWGGTMVLARPLCLR